MVSLLAIFCSFTFYKLARLYHIFSNANTNTSAGYPTVLFFILYVFGGCILCEGIALTGFIFFNSSDARKYCSFEEESANNEVVQIATNIAFATIVAYFCYDIFTDFLYWYKIHQFNQRMKDINRDVILQRIRFVLNKILFLTALILFILICGVCIAFFWYVFENMAWLHIVGEVSVATSMVIVGHMVSLMLEHNQDDYLRVLHCLDKVDCCYCCCKGLIDNARPHMLCEDESSLTNDGTPKRQDTGNRAQVLMKAKSIQSNVLSVASEEVQRVKSARLSTLTQTDAPDQMSGHMV
eukprot:CAMPEP_0197028664 /NCGR_PEP_ID=MMETSP1384-20130603/8295_1 /TAXON_ID=29189 /ORGANISM="Ammonia sp." /LENGTH=295 /DNA_ID=CAMNT_0042457697 /DNA_START=308 /DNA_END=1195 /DNA_ORIENTATION=+